MAVTSVRILCWSLLAITISATPLSTPTRDAPDQRLPLHFAPLIAVEHPYGTVNNSYIVMLRDDVHPRALENHLNFLSVAHEADPLRLDGAESGLRRVYDGHIKGYSGMFTGAVIQRIREMREVEYVERDQIVRTQEVREDAPWGLARISHRPKLTFATFTRYLFDKRGGEGVDVYVIDTGVNTAHIEFEGRTTWGKTIPPNEVDVDDNGHGMHCAGTIASRKYGIAKAANVVAIKVLGANGSGRMADVIGGVVWAAEQAIAKAEAARAERAATGKAGHKGLVVNLSIDSGTSATLERAVDQAAALGVHFAVVAGKSFTLSDAVVHYVLPSWASTFLSSPRLLEVFRSTVGPSTISPAQLKKALLDLATKDALADVGVGLPNLLIFKNATG